MSDQPTGSWIKVLEESELKENTRRVVTHGDNQILLINHKGELHAVNNRCPHLGFPLKSGNIDNANCIHCPFHRSAFNLNTGDVAEWAPWPPGAGIILGKLSKRQALEVYGIRVQNAAIEVDLSGKPQAKPDPNATKILTPPEGSSAARAKDKPTTT